jgi:ABC-2 type transport system permease protein
MILLRHELRRGRLAFIIWSGVLSFILAVCVFVYPQMKSEMAQLSDAVSSMGALTEAFGMDRMDISTLLGYYAIECGNTLSLGGALFAALTAVNMLSKEERDRTAEFLLTHPITRTRVVWEKLAALFIEILLMNLAIAAVSALSVLTVGEEILWKKFFLIHLAMLLLQLEIAGICFGISAFLRRGGAGLGLGIAVGFYAMNLIANITESARFLKTLTPFGYCEGADLLSEASLDWAKIGVGMAFCAAGIAAAFWKYNRKDIH